MLMPYSIYRSYDFLESISLNKLENYLMLYIGNWIERSAATFEIIFALGINLLTTLKIGIPSAVADYFTNVRLYPTPNRFLR